MNSDLVPSTMPNNFPYHVIYTSYIKDGLKKSYSLALMVEQLQKHNWIVIRIQIRTIRLNKAALFSPLDKLNIDLDFAKLMIHHIM